MTKLRLSLACTHTDRSAPLLDGRIAIEGCEIIPLPGQTQDIFRRTLSERAFDIAEMSMSSHIVQCARGVTDYVGIPVFLSRAFRHASLYIRTDRGIARPEDLAGRTIGIEQFQQTVGLWVRGMLGDQHGVRTQDVQWRTGGLEAPGGGERLALSLPPEIRLEPLAKGETLNAGLAEGSLDAVIATRPPSCFTSGHPQVARLFSDYRTAEIAYFKASGLFPIMHGLVLRRRLVDENPWLPVEVFRAFAKAKRHALSELEQMNVPRVSLAWIAENVAETRAILGKSLWAYGLEESRRELAAMLRYAAADGLTATEIAPETLFHPSTHGLRDGE
ncbi:ABC transporter substrate-binding protein [Ancylobacter sp. Lp-2]|uniref:ABC transporter substrate-binding protein n=1 Tax=Ancylobacter sp. Lp-2 TaxID=2881339 RepID=UPI001E39012E|nr:ABC transporter substrate-binding protein [Ancylobacter sp. Lp-2]MCB4769659.1 ABC transporter substrate-binding protein [Ancylobacter sp. Lp-2]